METGEVLAEANQELTPTMLAKIMEAGIAAIEVFFPERDEVGNVISMTLKKDPIKMQNEALIDIYRKLRPGDPPTLDTATQLFQGMFFDPRKYDFSRVGPDEVQHQAVRPRRLRPEEWLNNRRQEPQPLDRRTLDQKISSIRSATC